MLKLNATRTTLLLLFIAASGGVMADDAPADPVEHYLQVTTEQLTAVETARLDPSGRPLDLTEFNDAYSGAMAAAISEQQQNDLFAHHHKVLECMSDRRHDGDAGISVYQLRARCKSELSDLTETVEADGRKLTVQQQAAARAQAMAPAPSTPGQNNGQWTLPSDSPAVATPAAAPAGQDVPADGNAATP